MFRPAALALCLVSAAGGAACIGPPESIFGVDSASGADGDGEAVTAAMRDFSWVIEDEVAAMPRPGGSRPLEDDLDFLEEEGVDVLVSLTETPIDPVALDAHGLAGVHIPVEDFTAPTMAQLDEYMAVVEEATANGLQVGTHCLGGRGRSGTFVAALFVYRGMTADEAIAEIRRLRPGSIETGTQLEAVRQYERLLERRATATF